jgi:hypothetical protein
MASETLEPSAISSARACSERSSVLRFTTEMRRSYDTSQVNAATNCVLPTRQVGPIDEVRHVVPPIVPDPLVDVTCPRPCRRPVNLPGCSFWRDPMASHPEHGVNGP